MSIVLLAVDGLNLIRRVHAGTPEGRESGHFDSALAATVQSLRRALSETAPSHAVVVLDGEGPTWRHGIYPDYKAGRKPMPEELRRGMGRYRSAFTDCGVATVSRPETEADDVIATLAAGVAARGGSAVILSTDNVFCQLLGERIRIRDHFGRRDLDESYVREKFGVGPEMLVDLWALAGQSTTHIPGVPGIGIKTARKLLEEHGSLAGVLAFASGSEGRLAETLRRHEEGARISYELSRLHSDVKLGWNLRSFRYSPSPPCRGGASSV